MNAPSRIAPPFPLNPAVGERHGNWVWNGVIWTCSPTTGIQVLTTVMEVSGPYMPSPGLVSVEVECFGGGGGGGPAGPTTTATYAAAGGGGGSGGYTRKTLPASLVLGGVQVTIGQGGTGGLGSNAGTAGGATTFGALCSANGGAGGTGSGFSANAGGGAGGAGAAAGVGDVAFAGACGFNGGQWNNLDPSLTYFTISGGIGGSMLGGATTTNVGEGSATGSQNAAGFAAGGSGGAINQVVSAQVGGGNGGNGLCVITEYCWATDGVEDCMNPPINVNARVAVTQVPWPGPGPCPPGWDGGCGPYDGDG